MTQLIQHYDIRVGYCVVGNIVFPVPVLFRSQLFSWEVN